MRMIDLLRADLKSKFETFANLRKHPALFIADYFYLIRNEIDYEAERLMFESNENLVIERINEMRETLIDELTRTEKTLLSNAPTVAADQQHAERFENLQAALASTLEAEATPVEELKKLAVDIESASHEFKRGLLKNQTFMFIKFGLTDYGTLVVFEDVFLNDFEIKCIMTGALFRHGYGRSPVTETFQYMDCYFNENRMAPFELPRNLTKSLFVLWELEKYLRRTLYQDQFLLRLNRSILSQTDDKCEPEEAFAFYEARYFYNFFHVDMAGCELESIDIDAFDYFTKVEELHLDNNKLTSIDPGLFVSLVNLQKICLSGNPIEYIEPTTFQSLVNLQKIFMYENKLKRIHPDTFSTLKQLKEIYIGGNNIAELDPRTFRNQTSLQTLVFCHNGLNSLDPTTFSNLVNLQRLNLNGNNLTSIHPDTFKNLKKLFELYLYDNKLKQLELTIFDCLENLSRLYFYGNPIVNMKEMCRYLRSQDRPLNLF